MIQVHDLWGMIARDVYSRDEPASLSSTSARSPADDAARPPWEETSRYMRMVRTLQQWENSMPQQHRWSPWNLRGFKAGNLDLAYLSIVTIARLNNIVLRRRYLGDIFSHLLESPSKMDRREDTAEPPASFWKNMAQELFDNVWDLFGAIDLWYSLRSPDDGFPAILALSIYTCGSLSSYLVRWPALCPHHAPAADRLVQRSLVILSTFEDKWPAVSEWIAALEEVVNRCPSPPPGHIGGRNGADNASSTGRGELTSQEIRLDESVRLGHSPQGAGDRRSLMNVSDAQIMNDGNNAYRGGGARIYNPSVSHDAHDLDVARREFGSENAPPPPSDTSKHLHSHELPSEEDAARGHNDVYEDISMKRRSERIERSQHGATVGQTYTTQQGTVHADLGQFAGSGGGDEDDLPFSGLNFPEPFDDSFAYLPVQGYIHFGLSGWE